MPGASHFPLPEVSALRALAQRFPTVDATIAEIAYLEALLQLPKGVVHVISDVHGDHKKLQHVLNNASGSLRPLVEEVFGQRLSAAGGRQLAAVSAGGRQCDRVPRDDRAGR